MLGGDVQKIVIGMRTNIQDGTVIHGATNGPPVIIGDDVTVGHGAISHDDQEFEGMAASANRYVALAERYRTARPVILTF